MAGSLEQRLEAAAPLLAELWPALAACLQRAGIEEALAVAGTPPARGELREDPYDHSQALYAEWRSAGGALLGSLLVHADGQAFAEFDVLLAHPRRPQWVIEAVTAWGRVGALKSELRLLPALGS
ncbi:hypothetical protein OF001_U150086 [Pseudomonas sp. OF001]|uniref:hypothetical protein n=1 Tax=Pseudomonas sp. OF001 TaxID=2772300 RepID=UPI001918B50F|nr:hypothetical protein [Pseudomonas sp. OF001]CAD5376557.1 hypothetical protein OF001_U150086 [Pseudomonas sp. OF001]